MNLGLRILIVPGLVGVAYFAIAVWSDSADERRRYVQANLDAISPWAKFSQEPNFPALQSVVVRPADDTARLQAMAAQSRTIDLGGKTWVITSLRLGAGNWTISNGTLLAMPAAARDGIIELRAEPVSLTCNRVRFIGPWSTFTDDVEQNRSSSRVNGVACWGINPVNGVRADAIICRDCDFSQSFGGVFANHARRVRLYRCDFFRIATQCLGSVVYADNRLSQTHEMDLCRADQCGSLFDFSAPGATAGVTPPVVPVAIVARCTCTNNTGRTKIHGQWRATIRACTFSLTRPIPNRYAAISVPNSVSVLVDSCDLSGYQAGGLESSNSTWIDRPELTVRNTRISGGQIAINSSAWTHVDGSGAGPGMVIDDCVIPWGGSTVPASVIDTVIQNPRSVETMANQFVSGGKIVQTWNWLNNTGYDPARWWYILPDVRAAMNAIGN